MEQVQDISDTEIEVIENYFNKRIMKKTNSPLFSLNEKGNTYVEVEVIQNGRSEI